MLRVLGVAGEKLIANLPDPIEANKRLNGLSDQLSIEIIRSYLSTLGWRMIRSTHWKFVVAFWGWLWNAKLYRKHYALLANISQFANNKNFTLLTVTQR